jgi:hypothetical protein
MPHVDDGVVVACTTAQVVAMPRIAAKWSLSRDPWRASGATALPCAVRMIPVYFRHHGHADDFRSV